MYELSVHSFVQNCVRGKDGYVPFERKYPSFRSRFEERPCERKSPFGPSTSGSDSHSTSASDSHSSTSASDSHSTSANDDYHGESRTVSFHNFKSQKFNLSVSNPKSKYVVYLPVLSQISNCQGLGRKNKHEILKTDCSTSSAGADPGGRAAPRSVPLVLIIIIIITIIIIIIFIIIIIGCSIIINNLICSISMNYL